MLAWRGEHLEGSHPQKKNYRQLTTVVGKLAFPRDEPLYWLSKTKYSALKPHIYNIYKHIQHIYVYIHACNNNEAKEATNLKMGDIKGFKEG